jgi:hypothetical protein
LRLRGAIGRTQHANSAASTFADKQIAIRRYADLAWMIKAAREFVDDKTGRDFRRSAEGTLHDVRVVAG